MHIFILSEKLKDGIPLLEENLSHSPPSVPSEKEHASCERNTIDLPFLPVVPETILNAPNSIWESAVVRSGGKKYRHYCSESDIAYIVRWFLESIMLALQLNLRFHAEVTIHRIKPDISILLMGRYMVGVVEVKKPGNNILLQPTVLGELLDQMLLVEGFYGNGPVIGILTTGEEWLVSWFPEDTASLSVADEPEASFTTPMEQSSSASSAKRSRTLSQQQGTIHVVDEESVIPSDIDDSNAIIPEEMDRVLCATNVMNIHKDPILVLQNLCSALNLMSTVHLRHTNKLSRCLLKFHKDSVSVTFHPACYEDVYSMVDFDKFPSSNTKTLIALEDLGRGSTGKAWLCVTVTKLSSAVCVLKFDNKYSLSENLRKEREMWHLLYPEFKSMVKLEKWSGSEALVMPHFSTVLKEDREKYQRELLAVLTKRFADRGKVHRDVHWRNIGTYRRKSGEVDIVLFDLLDVVDYKEEIHFDWIDKAMKSLFVN